MAQTNSSHFTSRRSSYELLLELGNAVFEKKPMLGELYKKFGKLSLFEFTKQQFDIPINDKISDERKNEAITIIAEHAKRLLGENISQSITKQLKQQYAVITADHHGPITHSSFINSNLINSLYFSNHLIENIIVLSSANISFDNFTYPRGHLIHSDVNNQIVENQLVFFPRKVRPLPVFNYPSYTIDSLQDMKNRLEDWIREGIIKKNEAGKICEILNEVYANPFALAQKTFSDQVTITNAHLWKKLFASNKFAPNLLYIEQEQIVISLLLKYHIYQNSLINNLLFNDKYHILIQKYFNGVTSAFDANTHYGTYLFWALPKNQKYRMSLWKKGNTLTSLDGSYSVELTPESIAKALSEKEIYPSTMLSFIILGFYYGLSLVGGRSQTTYYSQMKHAYIRMQNELGDIDSISACKAVQTDRLSFPSSSVALLKNPYGGTISATYFDLLLYGNNDFLSTVEKMAQRATFEQALLRGLPSLYTMAIEKGAQDEDLLAVTENDVDLITGFDQQKLTCGEIKNKNQEESLHNFTKIGSTL